MNRAVAISFAFALAACGSKGHQSVCVEQPPPAACSTMCDPNGANTCPLGFFCNTNGKCDAECTVGGNQCGSNAICTSDGHCMSTGSGTDASCPAVHFTPMKTTPSIELLLDRSGSMSTQDINPDRYDALHTALTGTNGAIKATQANVYFGAALFSGDETPCPPNASLDGFSVPRALNNNSAIDALIAANGPSGDTPTAEWIAAVQADFAAHAPPSGSPPIILLATDGEPNSCNNSNLNPGPSIAAAKAAYNAGIRLFIIGLAGLNTQFLQDMANAGTGQPTGQAPNCTGCSPFYTANNPQTLAMGLNSIINGVLSCDLTLTGMVDPTQASQGTVTLNGMQLMYGTDWTLDPNGMTIHLIGQACATLQSSSNPTVDASFPCGAVIQ